MLLAEIVQISRNVHAVASFFHHEVGVASLPDRRPGSVPIQSRSMKLCDTMMSGLPEYQIKAMKSSLKLPPCFAWGAR